MAENGSARETPGRRFAPPEGLKFVWGNDGREYNRRSEARQTGAGDCPPWLRQQAREIAATKGTKSTCADWPELSEGVGGALDWVNCIGKRKGLSSRRCEVCLAYPAALYYYLR